MNETLRGSTHSITWSDGASTAQDAALIEQQQRRDEWKRRQKLQPGFGTLLAPTLPDRINRLNPQERHEVRVLIKSMKLRKIIRHTLAEAFWLGEAQKPLDPATSDSMQRLRHTVRAHESLQKYARALTGSDDALTFEPTITNSPQPTLIEVPR